MYPPQRPASFRFAWLLIALVIGTGCAPAATPVPAPPTIAPLTQIALTYEEHQDLIAARAALAGLGLADPLAAVSERAQQEAAAGQNENAQALAALAAALQLTPESPHVTAETNPTATAEATAAPLPSATPVPNGFELVSRERVCERVIGSALLEVFTQDANGAQIGGLEVQVSWNGGSDRFFTGLKPEIGPGYGDFQMEPGVNYRVRLASAPQVVAENVLSEACATDTTAYPGGVRLVFRQTDNAP